VTSPADRYRERLGRARAILGELEGRSRTLGIARLATFLAGIALAGVVVAQRGGVALAGVGAAALGFLLLVVWHERVIRAREAVARSASYFERGLARLEDRWLDGGDDGSRFADEQHLYASDLEIFGRGSLFHLLATTRTETGAARLAGWFGGPASPEVVRERQAAVRELAAKVELRHDLAVVAPAAGKALDSGSLRGWLSGSAGTFPTWLGAGALILALLNVGTVAAALAGWIPGQVVLVPLIVSYLVASRYRGEVSRVLAAVDRPARELRVIATLLDRVATEPFQSAALVRLSAGLREGGATPRTSIDALERLVDLADARRNQLFLPVSWLLLLGTQVAWRIERWRREVGPRTSGWLDQVGELEALASLATHAFEHPDDAYPEISPPGSPIDARGLAHVLLPAGRAIRNDLALGGDVRLVMVSGSNMSGKSTLLKAIGSNLVLAFAGAPVRATALSTPPLALGASLVLRDSLLEGRSRFYAEVLRLKEIAALARGGTPVLFLLDELLSGTNSHDRAIGARGVLLGLVDRGAVGLVTTHDLALTRIATDLGARGLNVHLEDRLVDGRLEFDYRLKPGVVERSNALELMRAVGLELPT
jgi:hypothetical protein